VREEVRRDLCDTGGAIAIVTFRLPRLSRDRLAHLLRVLYRRPLPNLYSPLSRTGAAANLFVFLDPHKSGVM
jgi:hypothetical protein